MDPRGNSEKGQALVLITLAIVALLGFTAVAVDGSMVYSDRRYHQSIADSSAMAATASAAAEIVNNNITEGTWNCQNTHVKGARNAAMAAAKTRAATNNMLLDGNIDDQHGIEVTCVNSAADKYVEVTVMVTQDTPTSFAHMVTGSPLRNTVTAVSRVYPRQSLAFGYTIVALNPASCSGNSNGANFHGNPLVKVCGGGIFANGCLRGKGNIDVTVKDVDCSAVAEGKFIMAKS